MINYTLLTAFYTIVVVLLMFMAVCKFEGNALSILFASIKRLFTSNSTTRTHTSAKPSPDPVCNYALEINDQALADIRAQRALASDEGDEEIRFSRIEPKSNVHSSIYRLIRQAKDETSAGDIGEKILANKLAYLKRKGVISGYTSTKNMVIDNRNFEIDFIVKLPQGGVLIIEAKFLRGNIFCTNQEKWLQKLADDTKKQAKNAASQAVRAMSLARKLLRREGHDLFLTPLVVHTHPNANIYVAEGAYKPQCDITILENLEAWCLSQGASGFSPEKIESLQTVLGASPEVV